MMISNNTFPKLSTRSLLLSFQLFSINPHLNVTELDLIPVWQESVEPQDELVVAPEQAGHATDDARCVDRHRLKTPIRCRGEQRGTNKQKMSCHRTAGGGRGCTHHTIMQGRSRIYITRRLSYPYMQCRYGARRVFTDLAGIPAPRVKRREVWGESDEG